MYSIDSVVNEVQSHPIASGAKMAAGVVVAHAATTTVGSEVLVLGVKRLLPDDTKAAIFNNEIVKQILPYFPDNDLTALTGLGATWITNSYSGSALVALVAGMFFTGSVIKDHAKSDRDQATVEKVAVGAVTFAFARTPIGSAIPVLMGLTAADKIGLTKEFKTLESKMSFAGKCLMANLACSLMAKGVSHPVAYAIVALAVTGLLMNTDLGTVAQAGKREAIGVAEYLKNFAVQKSTEAFLAGKSLFSVDTPENRVEEIV